MSSLRRKLRPGRRVGALGMVMLLLSVAFAASSFAVAPLGGLPQTATGTTIALAATARPVVAAAAASTLPSAAGAATPAPIARAAVVRREYGPDYATTRTTSGALRPAPSSPPALPPAAPAILLGASDICVSATIANARATSRLVAARAGTVFTAGDNSNDSGTAAQYTDCFGTTWGAVKARLHPAAGNHDYMTSSGAPYYAYFNAAAGTPGRGWYAYDLAAGWHVIVLNSNCSIVSCAKGSEQEQWLAADLAANAGKHVIAIWHQPRFTSGVHGNNTAVASFWDDLYAAHAEIVINGHDHDFEVFHRQTPAGAASTAGIREFVVGTGGAPARAFATVAPNSWVRHSGTFGILKLVLYTDHYSWSFIPVPGSDGFSYSGSTTTH